MEKTFKWNVISNERIDLSDWRPIELKSREELLSEMVSTFTAHMGGHVDVRPGTAISALFETMAGMMAEMQFNLAASYNSVNLGGGTVPKKTWVYPDGQSYNAEPTDGQQFDLVQTNQIDSYIWDGFLEKWVLISMTDKSFVYLQGGQFTDKEIKLHKDYAPECECGSEKSGSNRHSNWCKKFNPDA